MKNSIKHYLIIWLLFIVTFNLVYFLMPDFFLIKYSFMKFSDKYWIGYASVMLSLIIHLIFMLFQSVGEKDNKLIVYLSSIELILVIIISLYSTLYTLMIPNISAIYCVVSIILSIVILVLVDMVETKKNNANDSFNNRIAPYKEIMNKLNEILVKYPNSDNLKKLYEEMKYSDPTSLNNLNLLNDILDSNNKTDKEIDELALKALQLLKQIIK